MAVLLRLALDNCSLLRGLLGQVVQLQLISAEFGHMTAFLQKVADFDQENDPQLIQLIGQLREVSCYTEDILDEYLYFFASHRQQGFLASAQSSFKNLQARYQLAHGLQQVRGKIKDISEARLRYESHYASTLSRVPGRLASDSFRRHSKDDDAQPVGIDEPKHHLISHLLDVDSKLKVISVVGMGGLGKNTLVRKVYDDAAVESHFQIRVWVPVSQNCDFRNLLKGLIQQLLAQFKEPIPQQMDSMNIYQLKALLKEFLRRGRYAIVFDDVWEGDFWDAIKLVLPENSDGGNRVMFTTRIADVASASSVDSHTHVYEMGYLNSRDSWTLFCRKVFKDKQCPKHLMNVAESIVGKCGGLPLAIVAIGGLLASKDSSRKDEWELVQHRLRDEFEGSGKLERVKRILALNDLPSTLKVCLLYTSIYPQGLDIPIRHLIHLLVAERFVKEREGQTAEEIAWDCLKELSNRSLIQLNQVIGDGLYGFIHIDDLVRELIASKSRVQNMVTTISSTEQRRTGLTPSPRKVVHRLVFDHNLLEITSLKSHLDINSCRSIITFGEKKYIARAVLISKLLTVLDLRGVDLEEIPEKIFKLYLLRHLSLSGKSIRKVPKSIGRLQNLECVILEDTNVKELPMEIQKLRKLGHLSLFQRAVDSPKGHLGYNGFKPPSGMGKLLELQSLLVIDAAESDKTGIVKEIGNLAKLRKLWLKNLRREDGKELCSSLEKLSNLRELVVSVNSSVEKNEIIDLLDLNHPISASSLQSLCWLELFGRLEKIPPWTRNLQRLERITLSLSNLMDDPLETLQYLPNLSQVFFTEAHMGESLCFRAGGFLKLKKLYLENMKGLKQVIIEKGAMPGINELTMEELPLLEELPFGIEHLAQLQRLELWDMSSQLTNKLESEDLDSEDRKKISHVPQVLISFLVDGRWESHWLSRRKKLFSILKMQDDSVIGEGN